MLLTLLILLIVINAVIASIIGLTALDKPSGFERKILLTIASVLVINLAAFLTIYASYYGASH